MPSRLGIHVGGTHTECLLFDDSTGRTHGLKIPSTPEDPAAGIARGLAELIRTSGIRPADIDEVVCGTSVPADLLQSRGGAKIGLLVTRGFEQVLHRVQSQRPRTPAGWVHTDPQPLVDLAMTRGIAERMSSRGDAIVPLDETSARRAIGELLNAGAQSLTVCLLHAYANPAHESRLKAIIRDVDGQVPVTLSHELTQESGEYERALAAVVNAYVQPVMQRYVSSLHEKLQSAQINPRVSIVQSTGARASADHAIATPVHTMVAGPAGGAAGAAHIASLAGYPDALALNMGGTSTDICLIRDAAARMSSQTALQHGNANIGAINLPSLDVRRIGAGGGAIAQVSLSGTLRVGAPSAGSVAGPAGLRRGAALPTVTDANVVLGRLAATPQAFNVQAAEEAVASLARELGLAPQRLAEGIIDIANENMAGALRRTALEKGVDPARLALVAFGGAGPMHACALGMLTGCTPVIVPRHAGVLSALGFLCSPYSTQYAQTIGRRLDALALQDINEIIERLGGKASAWLAKEVPSRDGKIRFRADIGYLRHAFQASVSVDPATLGNGGLSVLAGQFDEAHQQRFGFKRDDPIQLITMRAIASAPADRLVLPRLERGSPDPTSARVRQIQTYFDGTFLNTTVYDRERLVAGNRIAGPAIITERDATTVIHPGHLGEVDEYLNVLIRPNSTQH